MVVLVRCTDNTVTVALESHLSQLIMEGLITSFLRAGNWIDTVNIRPGRRIRTAPHSEPRYAALVTCF
jgi:hypothetical protein